MKAEDKKQIQDNNFLKEPYQYKILNPFGPKIGIVKLSDVVVNKMITLTDKILSDDNKVSNGPNLAGQIEEESIISLELLAEDGLYDYFNSIQKQYILSVLGEQEMENMKTGLVDMWLVNQYENEYNPIHWHEGCTLSAVMYLKIPEYIPRNLKGKPERDGNITFINNNHHSPYQSLENPIYSFGPEVGDMFIFPSRLLHTVYPFKGDGERRSVSFNGVHMRNKDTKNKEVRLF